MDMSVNAFRVAVLAELCESGVWGDTRVRGSEGQRVRGSEGQGSSWSQQKQGRHSKCRRDAGKEKQ